MNALAEFNTNPYDVNAAKITFEDVYERWSDEHFPSVSHSNVQGYKAAWALCEKIARMRFVDVKLDHLQIIVDESGKNYPTLRKLKTLLGLMYKYAIIHEIIPKERNMIEYLNIKNAGNPNAYDRKPQPESVLFRLLTRFSHFLNTGMNIVNVNISSAPRTVNISYTAITMIRTGLHWLRF